MKNILAIWKKFDFLLVVLLLFMNFLGLAALYGIGLGKETPDLFFFHRQIVFVVLGIILMFLVGLIDYRTWYSNSRLLYIGAVVLLLGVFVLGKTIRGATGWFSLAGWQFQPIELAKVILILVLASFWCDHVRSSHHALEVGKSLFLMFGLFFLTALQPDFGSAILLAIIGLGFFVIIGLPFFEWLLLIMGGSGLFFLAWRFFFKEYQKGRILSFLFPNADPLGRGYSVQQSMIAIGSGRWWGSGLGFGSQSQLKFLPESHTDFIFAVMAQELGFVGVVILLTMTMLFLLRLIQLAGRLHDDYGLFVFMGAVVLFFAQIFLNVGVTLGILPVTGVTFPFVSYGGSSLLMSYMLIGVMQSIFARRT